MKIASTYSHLNGLEWLQARRRRLLAEVRSVISSVDAESCRTYASKARKTQGLLLYSPVALNEVMKQAFRAAGWVSQTTAYYLSSDVETLRRVVNLSADEQRVRLLEVGSPAYRSRNQTDFVKDAVAVEVQFGHYASIAYDLFVKHMGFFVAGAIEVGVEIVPTKEMLASMSSGPGSFEFAVHCIVRQGRSIPGVPVVLFGVEP